MVKDFNLPASRTNDNFNKQLPDTQKQIEAIMELRRKEREEELRKFREEDARRKAESESFSGKLKEFVKKVTATTDLNKPSYSGKTTDEKRTSRVLWGN